MKLGILGGTFDPIHEGHMAVADAACTALSLDRVLVIPSHHPPHRRTEPHASAYHRFAMVALAVLARQKHPEYIASDLELLAPDRSYTSLTLRRLHEDGYSASQLFFMTGADAFAEIETWHDYPAILDLASFVVVSRPNHPATRIQELLPSLCNRVMIGGVENANRTGIWLIDAPTPDVSSTEIRRRIREGESIAGMVAPDVETYIRRHSLYKDSR